MLTALFSVTFTSCIDNEVSPVVEAIYEAQADLIAAQAGVQNAEAALLLAQANAENALAAQREANAAQTEAETASNSAAAAETLRLAIAENNTAIAAAQNAMELAQVEFEAELAAAIASMEAAGAQVAVGYAYDYRNAMYVANQLKEEKITKEGQLATAQLYLKAGTPTTTWALYLADLNADVALQTGKITAAEAAIVALNTAKANPTARETQIADLKSQVAVLTARQTELVALKALAQVEVDNAQAAITAAEAFMFSPSGTYLTAKGLLDTWKAAYTVDTTAVNTQSLLVTQYTTAIANYAGTTTTLTTAKNAAVDVVGQSTTLPYTGLKGDIKTLENTLGVYGTAPVYGNPARTATAPAVLTAQDVLWNADLALLTFEADFAALTASYNQAANDLVTATNTYNITDWTAENTAASNALTAAQGDVTVATNYYDAKKAIFEASPAGKTWFDLTTPLSTTSGVVEPYTNTRIGIHTDDNLYTTSYSLVTGWVETTTGNGIWVPTSLASSMLVAIPVGGIAYTGSVDTNIGNQPPQDGTAPTDAYYVEVEADDVFETNVDLFNDASTKLGVKITTAYYTGTSPRVYAADFTVAPVTAYQALWNAEKLVSYNLYAEANAAAILQDAQDDYDYQKSLFEAGLTTRATLEDAVTAAEAVVGQTTTAPYTGLLGDIDAKSKQLGNTAFGTPNPNTDVAKTTSGTLGSDYYMVGTVKTLTAYAVKWNAELALAKHLATTLAQYQTMLANAQAALTTATREAAEDLIFIAKYTADLAAIQAQYDALILTPLYAELNVAKIEADQALAVLVAEGTANASMISSLNTVISALQTTVPDYTALISAQNTIITNAKAALLADQIAISQGEITVAGLQATVVRLQAEIVVLTQRIANAEAIAAKYKALMDAALAS